MINFSRIIVEFSRYVTAFVTQVIDFLDMFNFF